MAGSYKVKKKPMKNSKYDIGHGPGQHQGTVKKAKMKGY